MRSLLSSVRTWSPDFSGWGPVTVTDTAGRVYFLSEYFVCKHVSVICKLSQNNASGEGMRASLMSQAGP